MLYFLARRSPPWMMRSVMAAMTDPDRNFTDKNIGRMRAPETELLRRRPELVAELSLSMKEAHRQGYDGAVQEWRLYTRPWGFPLDGIRGHVDLWYGEDDGNAPPGMGRALHQMLPDSTLHLVPGEAHLSLMNNRLEDILLATRSG
jgi:pimeloyl-ACP methyl ester carboxylesterase